MSPAELRNDVVYLTPLGRRCQLIKHGEALGSWGNGAFIFRYLRNKRSEVIGSGDGFALTARNLRILRQEFRP